MESRHFFQHSDVVETVFQDRDICQDTGVKTQDETFPIRLRQDETETSFKCLTVETETLPRQGSKT